MKTLILLLLLSLTLSAKAATVNPPYFGTRIDTTTGQASQYLSGTFHVAADSQSADAPGILLDGSDGSVHSFGLFASSAYISNSMTASSMTSLGDASVAGTLTAGALSMTGPVSGATSLTMPNNDALWWKNSSGGSVETMVLTPANQLTIGAGNSAYSIHLAPDGEPLYFGSYTSFLGSPIAVSTITGGGIYTPYLEIASSSVFHGDINAGASALVTSGGNVGVGTASPSSRLDVNGDIRAEANSANWSAADGLLMDYYALGSQGRFVVARNGGVGGSNSMGFNVWDGAAYQQAFTVYPASAVVAGTGGFTGSLWSTGFSNRAAGTGPGLEMGWDGTESLLQSYNRTTSVNSPMAFTASNFAFNAGQLSIASGQEVHGGNSWTSLPTDGAGVYTGFSGDIGFVSAVVPGVGGRELDFLGYPLRFLSSQTGGILADFSTSGALTLTSSVTVVSASGADILLNDTSGTHARMNIIDGSVLTEFGHGAAGTGGAFNLGASYWAYDSAQGAYLGPESGATAALRLNPDTSVNFAPNTTTTSTMTAAGGFDFPANASIRGISNGGTLTQMFGWDKTSGAVKVGDASGADQSSAWIYSSGANGDIEFRNPGTIFGTFDSAGDLSLNVGTFTVTNQPEVFVSSNPTVSVPLADSTWQRMYFGSEDRDTAGMFVAASSDTVTVTPDGTHTYEVCAGHGEDAPGAAARHAFRVFKNGSTTNIVIEKHVSDGMIDGFSFRDDGNCKLVRLTQGDYLQMDVYEGSAGTDSLFFASLQVSLIH